MVQTGSRTQNFQIALQELWFMEKPITLGFDVFKRHLRVPQFTRKDTGANLIWGIPVKRFSRLYLNYGYAVIETTPCDEELFGDLCSSIDPFLGTFGQYGEFRQSKVAPTLVHNTVDQPLFAYTGKRYTLSLEYAGGPLGGTVNFYKPTVV